MPRLNAEMRADIVRAVTAHAFKDRLEDHCNAHATLALDIYNDIYDAATRRRMEGLPKSWLPTLDNVYVRAAGSEYRFQFNGVESAYGKFCNLHVRKVADCKQRVTHGHNGSIMKTYDIQDDLHSRIEHFISERSNLHEEIKSAHTKTAATLDTFFTTEKLVEAWPEIAPFIPEKSRPKPALPAVPTDDLNKMLGLPVTTDV